MSSYLYRLGCGIVVELDADLSQLQRSTETNNYVKPEGFKRHSVGIVRNRLGNMVFLAHHSKQTNR